MGVGPLSADRRSHRARVLRYGEDEGRAFVRDRAMVEEDRVILKIVPTAVVSWDYGKD